MSPAASNPAPWSAEVARFPSKCRSSLTGVRRSECGGKKPESGDPRVIGYGGCRFEDLRAALAVFPMEPGDRVGGRREPQAGRMQDRSQLIQRGASDAMLSPQFGLRQGGKVAERLEPIVKKEAEGFGLQVQFVDACIGRNRCAVVLCRAGSSRCPLGTALVARILPASETPRCHAPARDPERERCRSGFHSAFPVHAADRARKRTGRAPGRRAQH